MGKGKGSQYEGKLVSTSSHIRSSVSQIEHIVKRASNKNVLSTVIAGRNRYFMGVMMKLVDQVFLLIFRRGSRRSLEVVEAVPVY